MNDVEFITTGQERNYRINTHTGQLCLLAALMPCRKKLRFISGDAGAIFWLYSQHRVDKRRRYAPTATLVDGWAWVAITM